MLQRNSAVIRSFCTFTPSGLSPLTAIVPLGSALQIFGEMKQINLLYKTSRTRLHCTHLSVRIWQ
jgi:hypothetical protein